MTVFVASRSTSGAHAAVYLTIQGQLVFNEKLMRHSLALTVSGVPRRRMIVFFLFFCCPSVLSVCVRERCSWALAVQKQRGNYALKAERQSGSRSVGLVSVCRV